MSTRIIQETDYGKGEVATDLITQALKILEVGAANPIISGPAMFLIVTALSQIKTGQTYEAPTFSVGEQLAQLFGGNLAPVISTNHAVDLAVQQSINDVINFLTGGSPKPPPPNPPPQAFITPTPDAFTPVPPPWFIGPVQPGATFPLWNTYLLNATDAFNLKVTILGYIVATGVGGSGLVTQLSGLISTAVAAAAK